MPVVVIVVVALGLAGWLASRVLLVKDDLEAAQAEVSALQNGGDIEAGIRQLSTHADSVVETSSDPVWRVSEQLPWLGDNLRAVRMAGESLQVLSSDLALPVLDALGKDDGTPFLGRAVPAMQAASVRVGELTTTVTELTESPALIDQLRTGLNQVLPVLEMADPMLQIVPGMLGADGERNYLVVVQSNSESLALGGSASSQTLINISPEGEISIAAQADSSQYDNGNPVDVDIDQSAIDLYNEYLITHMNTTTGRPDFPTAARSIMAFWQRDIADDQIDGVFSIDALAISKVMAATGPVEIPEWGEVNAENVVSLVLSEVYTLTDDPIVVDNLLKVLAVEMFEKITAGDFDVKTMAAAVSSGIDTGSVMFYSTDEQIQQIVSELRVGGILPTTNDDETVIGVFFRDGSLGSKIDYYLKTDAKVTSTCSAGTTTFRVEVTVDLDVSQKVVDQLPDYVKGSLGAGTFRTQVFIYGPPGTTVSNVEYEEPTWKWRPVDIVDLGRPAPSFMTNHDPGESVTVVAEFQGSEAFAPLAVRTTPMVHTTQVATQDGTCSR